MEVRISDCRLHYEEAGSGEPLVLLHGNGEDCGYFARQVEYFSAKYRVIALDTRGHGNRSGVSLRLPSSSLRRTCGRPWRRSRRSRCSCWGSPMAAILPWRLPCAGLSCFAP